MQRIETSDKLGRRNGWLLPLWNVNERPDLRPDQVYLTVIAAGASKGPHLHKVREQRYYCIRGLVRVIMRGGGEYMTVDLAPGGEPVVVPPGLPSELLNLYAEESWVINMPAPAWSPDDQDDWPVENWKP